MTTTLNVYFTKEEATHFENRLKEKELKFYSKPVEEDSSLLKYSIHLANSYDFQIYTHAIIGVGIDKAKTILLK